MLGYALIATGLALLLWELRAWRNHPRGAVLDILWELVIDAPLTVVLALALLGAGLYQVWG